MVKLLPNQLVKYWDMLRLAIAESFMPRNSCSNAYLRHILASLLSGRSQCWAILGEDRKFVGFVITRVSVEAGIGERVLNVDTLYAYVGISDEAFTKGWRTLEEFARANKCKAIASMTENPRILQMVGKLGFTQRHYIVKEV